MKSPRREGRAIHVDRHGLLQAFNLFLPPALFRGFGPLRRDARWTHRLLLLAGVLLAWLEGPLARRFAQVREAMAEMGLRRRGRTHNGFVQALLRQRMTLTAVFMTRLSACVRELAEAGGCWRAGGFIPFGVDGTRVGAPRTAANLKGLGGLGRDRQNPQAWLTLLAHLPTGLPFAFTADRGDSAERDHLRQMLGLLPEKALVVADAGFAGYGLWRLMDALGIAFLFRVGGNVRLLTDLGGRAGGRLALGRRSRRVWLWPEQGRRWQAPLELRLIRLGSGRRRVFLVTNVLDEALLPVEQAKEFFRMRWGLELWFRAMKRTLAAHTLRSRAPRQALSELEMAATGLALLGLMQARALLEAGQPLGRGSCAGALEVVRAAMAGRRSWRRRALGRALAAATRDQYQRHGPKCQGAYPAKKKRRTAGAPIVRRAEAKDRRQYQELMAKHASFAFAA